MYFFHVLCVLSFLTSVLTSSTKNDKNFDHKAESTTNSTYKVVEGTLKSPTQNGNETFAKAVPTTAKINKHEIINKNQTFLEGGGKVSLASMPVKATVSEKSDSVPKPVKEGAELERNVSPRKEAILEQTRIKARKGVGNETASSTEDSSLEETKVDVNKTMVNASNKESVLLKVNLNSTANQSISMTKTTTEKAKKHKLKPTVTVGGSNVDAPIPASPTKSPPLGMPRKIDYVIPVMITIVTVPLLSVATYVLYRRGRDCWDKRHYRRMDFLIDGMYNE